MKLCQEHYGPEHSETATAIGLLGIAYHNASKFAEAVPPLDESIRIERIGGKDSTGGLHLIGYLAKAEIQTGQVAEAEELLLSAMDVLESRLANRLSLGGTRNGSDVLRRDRRTRGRRTVSNSGSTR